MEKINQDLENIKNKLFEHFEKNYSIQETENFKKKINSMEPPEFIEFLKNQGLLESPEKCVICSMISGKIPIVKIGENSNAISILEINPISQGHSMIIPKEHIADTDEVSEKIKDLAEEIARDLNNAFTPKKIEFETSNITGHQIINLIPIYSNETIESKRQQKTIEELNLIKEKIQNSKLKKVVKNDPLPIEKKEPPSQINEKLWLPKKMKP